MTVGEIDTSNDALIRKEKRKSRKHSETAKEHINPDAEAKPQGSSDKNIKTKHRRKEAAVVTVATEAMEEQATSEVSERKKKHRRHKDSEDSIPDGTHAKASEPMSEDTQDAELIDESKNKRKDKRKNADALGEDSNEAGRTHGISKETRKHKRREKNENGDEDVTEAGAEDEKKKRKRKKDRVSDETAEAESPKDTGHETGHGKKKRKHLRSGFPNPEGDDELSDQSKKALVYAYVYAENQSNWKFNKARQNWLVRNVWSDITTFVKACQTFVQSAETQNESQAGDNKTTQATDEDGATPTTAMPSAADCKRHRAEELLHVFTTSVAL
ncbi:hypothetical protein EIP86_001053 [Pleurotus ostreatoroseus]|nr:hypothetical protein EIP86_001053 [Pleurotus ostreatoroseus]